MTETFPSPSSPLKLHIPEGVPAADLLDACNAVWRLVTLAELIVFWMNEDLVYQIAAGITPEGVLGELPDAVARGIEESERLLAPVRLEIWRPENVFTGGGYHESCAHDAAIRFAGDVRRRLDSLVRAALALTEVPQDQFVPGALMRGRWGEIVRCYRERLPEWFAGLPSADAIRNGIRVEAAAAIDARRRDGRRDIGGITPLVAYGTSASDLMATAVAYGGDTGGQIYAVVGDGNLTTDQKQRAIYRLDNTKLGWSGGQWSELLGVSETACRDTDWWKIDRKRLRNRE